jgi:hypothetical protein
MFLERSDSREKILTNYKQGIQACEHKIYNCGYESERGLHLPLRDLPTKVGTHTKRQSMQS